MIHNVPSGTYTIVYLKNNFALMKTVGHQFIGNGMDFLGIQDLYGLLHGTVEIVFGEIVTSVWAFSDYTALAVMLYSRKKNISMNDLNSYFGRDTFYYADPYNGDTTKVYFRGGISSDIHITKGETIYEKAYVGTLKSLECYYFDLKSGRKIFTGFNNESAVDSFVVK
jgi:hypothetical protein